jgi:hypothetical protein
MLFPQSFIRVWFFWESRLQHKCTWWLQVLWTFWNKFWNFEIFWNFWNFKILWKFSIFISNFRILKFVENFEIFEIFWKFWNHYNLEFFWIFWNFVKISEFSLIDDEVRVFRINIKLLYNPVAELKIRENDSHCRSIVLKIMDRSTTGKGKK